jgi:hypothetical protein
MKPARLAFVDSVTDRTENLSVAVGATLEPKVIKDTLTALRATGATLGEAFALAATAFGTEVLLPLVLNHLNARGRSTKAAERVVATLDELASVRPDLARTALGAWGAGRNVPCLNLARRSWVTDLPEGLTVDGFLRLDGCENLECLPAGLRVGKGLVLSGCHRLRALPERLIVGDSLVMYDCVQITTLPDDLKVGEDLHLGRCIGITHLPEGLVVPGCLEIACLRIAALPARLRVGTALYLNSCANLSALPSDLQVGHYVLLDEKNPLWSRSRAELKAMAPGVVRFKKI